MNLQRNTDNLPALQALKHLSPAGMKTVMRYLGRRGWIFIQPNKDEMRNFTHYDLIPTNLEITEGVIPAKIVGADWDSKKNRITLTTNLTSKHDNQILVIDIYIIEEMARLCALAKGETLEDRYPDDFSHMPVKISFVPYTLH